MARRQSSTAAHHGVAHPQRRVRMLLLGTMIVFSLFAAQLVRLQGLDAATVSAAAIDERLKQVIIPATRGAITDVNGEPLAVDVDRVHIAVDPVNVAAYERWEDGELVGSGFSGAAQAVAEVTGEDPERLERVISTTEGRWAYLVKDVSPEVWQQVKDLGIPGVTPEEFHHRLYPLGESHAKLLGWLGAGEAPAGGVELTRHDWLTGTPGERTFEIGGNGEVITTGTAVDTPAVDGGDVRLSIDSDLQWYAYDALEKRVEEAKALSGYVLVQEVETGRIVTAATYPGFDPSDPEQTSEGMRNDVVEDVYEPGSTAKLVTAAAALEEGIVERDTPIVVPYRLPRGGKTFKDAHDPRTPWQTFGGVLATSSNMGTILYGEKLEDQQLHDWLRRFGLGTPSGLGLPGESGGVVPPVETWSRTSRYTLMFGQGLSSNALQQMSVYQTMANDGVRIPPTVVEGTTDDQGRYTAAPVPEGERVVSAETSQTLTEILEQVPTFFGTAPTAAVEGYHVAGKTSTADRYDDELGRYSRTTASFIGYAPSDDPKYVVAVTIQRPTEISQYGGTISGPVFADVMRYALQKAGVAPADEPLPELELTYDPKAQAPGHPRGVTLGDIAFSDERADG
ncbi:peptidoglycan D,D-transpeptidase FtsI family protein [Ornithinimicrobium sediminis]|uniref:peptidoglycan D,D-transpeptidase FtsI family protein n=1 Tax=Ornithinimicrobium sediminis TaxID=2904603 RepID=UPI001E6512A9|nr:penicillin-binding protein 2 [Ornithinimicrobium sediminis]